MKETDNIFTWKLRPTSSWFTNKIYVMSSSTCQHGDLFNDVWIQLWKKEKRKKGLTWKLKNFVELGRSLVTIIPFCLPFFNTFHKDLDFNLFSLWFFFIYPSYFFIFSLSFVFLNLFLSFVRWFVCLFLRLLVHSFVRSFIIFLFISSFNLFL